MALVVVNVETPHNLKLEVAFAMIKTNKNKMQTNIFFYDFHRKESWKSVNSRTHDDATESQ